MEVAGWTVTPPLLPEQNFWVIWLQSDTGHPAVRTRHSRKKSTGREKTKLTHQVSLFWIRRGNQWDDWWPRQTARIGQLKGTKGLAENWESRPADEQSQEVGWKLETRPQCWHPQSLSLVHRMHCHIRPQLADWHSDLASKKYQSFSPPITSSSAQVTLLRGSVSSAGMSSTWTPLIASMWTPDQSQTNQILLQEKGSESHWSPLPVSLSLSLPPFLLSLSPFSLSQGLKSLCKIRQRIHFPACAFPPLRKNWQSESEANTWRKPWRMRKMTYNR